ncbi:hypothetical protein BASA81_002520 [Batrachochytrium salamandrivorans]|nr:hypothetical protein BASA81_002520 [Batrachochytrium salamandrivorans]
MADHESTSSVTSESMFASGCNVPEERNRYVVFVCEDGHKTAVYTYPLDQTQIRQPGRCQHSVRNVAKSKIDIGIAHIDRPVAVWFAGKEGGMPWMSMLRACDKCFVDHECVPESTELQVEFSEKRELDDEESREVKL